MTDLAFKVATPDLHLHDSFRHLLMTKQLGRLCHFYSVDKLGEYYFYVLLRDLTEEGHALLRQLHEWKRAYRLFPDKPHEVQLLQPSWTDDHQRWEIELTHSFVKK
jgi:hypothetical protein